MHYLIQKTFERRGFSEELLKQIEDGHHTLPTNIDVMCDRLKMAHDNKLRIVLIPDFDMDGIASGTEGYAGFCELGFNFSLYLPNVIKGYGFNEDDINAIKQQWPDVQVIMTCDVGITCTKAIAYAKSLGLEVLVTDHHVGKLDNGADISVDPSAEDSSYDNVLGHSSICGAFVIYQVLCHYAFKYGTEKEKDTIERLIVLVGLGTVSDVMPMICENRIAVKDSLRILKWLLPSDEAIETYGSFNAYAKTPLSGYHMLGSSYQYQSLFYGIQAMLWYFKSEKHYDRKRIDEDFFGFTLAPMFNTIKRMGDDIGLAFGVFFDRQNCYENIRRLDALNDLRKQAVSEAMIAINEITQPFAPFIYLSDARTGLLGLLAAKLMQASGTPTIVANRTALEDGFLHGSGRSPQNYNFMEAIDRLKLPYDTIHVAGHPHAFGASLASDESLLSGLYTTLYVDTFADIEAVSNVDPFDTADFIIGSGSECDVYFDVFTLDDYLYELKSYKPFGHGFFRPNIAIRISKEDMAATHWFIIGKDSQHVKYCHDEGLDIVIWDGAGDTFFCKDGFSALGHLQYTEYDGEQQLSFVVDNLLEAKNELSQ